MTLPSFPAGAPLSSRTHRLFPSSIGGYRINGKFSICVPLGVDTTNLVSNPSLETNTTGYSASGGATIARTTAKQRRGAWSLQITPGAGAFDGGFFETVPTIGSTVYTFSCDFLGAAGVKYRIYVASTVGGAISGYYEFTAIGRWQRVSITFQENTAPSSATNRRLYFTKAGGASAIPFYVDGLCFCASTGPLTYFDGDSRGFVPGRTDFYWTGLAHGSASVMSGQTRAGGKLIPLANYGFTLLAMLGLGMTPLNNVSIPLAAGGGAFYQTTIEQDRTFDLVGALTGRNLQELQRRRHDLIAALRPDNVPTDQPLLLRYQPTDDCGAPNGHELDIVCAYESGLEGATNNHYQENLDLRFHIYLPFAAREDGWNGATLGYQQSVVNSAYINRRIGGAWKSLGTGLNGNVRVIVYDPLTQRIYVGGNFTTAGGATVNRICYWDVALGQFVAMDAGVNAEAEAIAIAPNGDVWVGGKFSTVGSGAAPTKGLAKWSISTNSWSVLTNTATAFNAVYALAFDSAGNLYGGGDFTQYAGVVNTGRIWKYNGAVFSALGTGMDDIVYSLLVDPAGANVYAGGNFVTGNSVTLNRVGYWNGTTFVALGAGGNGIVYALAFHPNGDLYAVGAFTTMGGGTVNRIGKWNGAAWTSLTTGLNNTGYSVSISKSGLVYVGGAFTTAGSLAVPDFAAGWNGSSWFFMDINLPGVSNLYATLAVPYNDDLYIGYDTTGTAAVAPLTSITNTGVVKTYPRLTLTGPGTVYQMLNYTTGRAIYFNLILNAGETAVLDFSDPQNVMFGSNFRPNLLSTILAGSNLDFFLMPGQNQVSLFIAGAVNVNTAAVIAFRNTYHSVDSAINISVVN